MNARRASNQLETMSRSHRSDRLAVFYSRACRAILFSPPSIVPTVYKKKKKRTIIRLSTLLRLARARVYPRYLSLQSDRAQSRTTFRATDHISTHATSQSCTNEFLSGSSDVRSFELILDDVVLHPKAALPLSPCPSFSRIFRLKLHYTHRYTYTRSTCEMF